MKQWMKFGAAALMSYCLISEVFVTSVTHAAPATAPTSAPAIDPEKVVIQIGDVKITAKEFEQFISDLPEQYQEAARGAQKRLLADQIVRVKLLAAEARKRGLENSPRLQRQLLTVKEQLLAAELSSALVDDTEAKKYYDEHVAEYEQLHARHILVRGEGSPMPSATGKETTDAEALKKAEDIRKRIAGGEDFAKVAQLESDDTGSGARGGDLGTFGHGQMVKPFEDAAFSLKPGDVSEPVKSQFGYHIIQVQEHRTAPFDEVKDQIKAKLGPDKMQALTAELRKSGDVKMDDEFFGPMLPPQ